MAARDAQNYRNLLDALEAKRKNSKLPNFKGFSYDGYYFALAKRLMAPMIPFRDYFTRDEKGNYKHFNDEDWKKFSEEVLSPRNEKVVAPFLNEKTAPEESDKFHEEMEQIKQQETASNTAQGEKQPEKKEDKKEEKEPEAPHPELKKATPEKPAEKPKNETQTGTVTPKPSFAVSPEGKVVGTGKQAPQPQPVRQKYEGVRVPVPSLPKRLQLIKNTQVPEPVKDVSSLAQRGVRKLIYKIRLLPILSGAVLGLIGFMAGGPLGAIGGAGIGVAGASFMTRGSEEEEEPESYITSQNQGTYDLASQGTTANPMRAAFNYFRPNSGGLMRSVGKQIGKQVLKRGAEAAAAEGAEAAGAAGVGLLAGTPVGWIIGGVVLVVALLIFVVIMKPQGGGLLESTSYCSPVPPNNGNCGLGGGGGPGGPPPTSSSVSIVKSGPSSVANGAQIPYKIVVTNNGTQPVDVDVNDQVPNNTDLVSASDNPQSQTVGSTTLITWHISELAANASQSFSLTVQPTQDDIYVMNTASLGTINPSSSNNTSTNSVGNTGSNSSNTNDCNGAYTSDIQGNPLNKNFGDPNCNFSKDGLKTLLNKLDPTNADFWFNVVVRGESNYDPNDYAPPSTGTPDANGAWGLFQMGQGSNGPGGQYDHGDVPWQQQTSNAVNLFQYRYWCYWDTARSKWDSRCQ